MNDRSSARDFARHVIHAGLEKLPVGSVIHIFLSLSVNLLNFLRLASLLASISGYFRHFFNLPQRHRLPRHLYTRTN